MSSNTVKKLLALRSMEEALAETEFAKQRQLRQRCLDALQAQEASKHVASRALNHALAIADRWEAISAEMALACRPLERRILLRQLAQLDRSVESAVVAWQNSRVRRLQIETVSAIEDAMRMREAKVQEQKSLDSWSLSSRSVRRIVHADEKFQREWCAGAEHDGTVRAPSFEE